MSSHQNNLARAFMPLSTTSPLSIIGIASSVVVSHVSPNKPGLSPPHLDKCAPLATHKKKEKRNEGGKWRKRGKEERIKKTKRKKEKNKKKKLFFKNLSAIDYMSLARVHFTCCIWLMKD